MVKVVKIWKGDLMMRSKSLAKNKDLQRKVLCSLLAAGVMSVCISGGDVWAAQSNEKIDLSGSAASTAYADWDMQIDSEGSFKGVYTHNGANLDFTGTETNIIINNKNNAATAVANYGNNGGVMNFDAAKTSITLEHTGNVGSASPRDMGVLVNQGTVNVNGDALIKLNTANTATMYGVNVECNTNDAVPSIVNFNKKAAIDIVTGDAATGIFVSGKPGSVLASGDNLNITINAGGNINGVWTRYGGTFSTGVSNNLNINLQSDSQYSTVTGIKCFSQKEGQDNSHAGMIDIDGSATINVQSANKAYGILNEYWQRPVDTGKVKVAGDLNITVVGKEAYGVLSDNKDCDTNILGNANINVTGTNSSYAIHAKEGGQITVGSAGKTVALKAETTAGDSGKLAAAGVYALNGGQVTIAGAKADIEADVTANGRAIGVRVEGKDASTTSAVQLNADTTNIAVNGTTKDNNFNEAAWVKNGSLTVNSKNLNVTGSMSGYTLEGLNVSTNGLIELNTEKTVIDIADDYGVTGITAHNGGTFKVNKGDLIITSTNTAANGVGKTNSIGIQSDEIGSGEPQNSIIIGPGVNKVDITVNGAGSEGATPNASNGTAGIYAVDGAIEIASGELNIRVNSGANVSSDASGVYSNATGIKGLNGTITVAGSTRTALDVTDGYQEATGVYAGSYGDKKATVSILGDTAITATGKTGAHALYAEKGSEITIGSKGKMVDLTVSSTNGGKVYGLDATGGSDITVNGSNLTIDVGSYVENGTINDRIFAIDASTNKGGKIILNSDEITIVGEQKGHTVYCDGVRANMSTIEFNGNTTIDLKADLKDGWSAIESKNKQNQFAGINVQCDPGNIFATAINFNGSETDIKVEGKATWFAAVQGSGVPGSINFTGKKVNITAVNNKAVREGDSTTVGIYAQYGATINSAAATDIVTTVEANGYANGIYNTNNFGYNGNVKLKGNFMGTVISNESSAYGIYNDPPAADNTGGEVYIGKGLKLDVTALKGEAVGIYGEGEHSKTTVLGDVTITTNGQNDSYSLYAAAKANITLGSAGKTVALTGDVTAKDADSIITLAGDSNVVKGTVTADAGGIVLGGSDKATYTADKFVTKGAGEKTSNAKSGTITVSGGTLNIDNLSDINKFDLADNSLIVTGKGVLKAASDKVFEADTSGKKVIAGVDQKVLFNGGKLAISDTSYTLADSKVYSEALGKVDDSGVGANTKTTIVMTGTLQDQPVDNKATVDDLAPTGAVHTNVTGTVSTGTLNVGDGSSSVGTTGINNDLGVKDLDFSSTSGSGTVDAIVTISNDTGLTLVGDGSSELLKGTGNSNNNVTVGSDSGSAGTLTLGNAAAESSGGTLNAAVTLKADSQMNVEAGSFTVGKITATEGTVAVNAGANLTTTEDFTVGDAGSNKSGTIDAAGSITAGKVDLQQGTVAVTGSLTANELSVGDSSNSKEGAVTAAGTVDVGTLKLNKGNIEVTGSLTAKTLTVGDNDAKIAVGAADSAGTLTAEDVKLGGASLMLDPDWEDSSTIQTASKAGLKFNSSQIDGKLTVGQNSVLSLGTADTAKAEAAFTDTGLTWGKNDITAALYIDYEQTMDSTKGGIKVDGSLTHASDNKNFAAANTATFAAGSLLMVAGDAALTTDGALKAGSTVNAQNNSNSNNDAATLKVDSGAKLYIADAQADKRYTIVSGFTNSGSAVTDGGWNGTNLLLNKLVKGSGSYSNGSFTVSTQKVKASEALPGVALPNILDAMSSQTDSPYAGIKYLSNAISGLNSNAQTLAAVNSFAQGAENSGATRTGALAALDLGTAVQEHLSLAKAAAEQSGGFGKAAVDTADNGGIWAQYIHNKDKVDNMGGVSYDGQYNGVIIGGDFADRGKYSSGIAFSYGSGDSTGSASKNEFDFWGLSYYGGIQNGDTNLIFDVGYSKTSSDVKGVIKAEPDTQVISMGIKGEKLISNGHGTSYVPYAGLRYMNIDTDSYNGSIDGKTAAHYSTDKADLWLLPVGISISHESVTAGGWKVRPTADIAYVWTLGDKNTAMDITVPGVNATDRLGYDIMDSGFFVGKLGLEAEKGDWTYGLGYACQKGSHAQNSKFMLNVTYSF